MIYLLSAFLFFLLFLISHITGYRLKIFRFQPLVLLSISAVWLGIYIVFIQKFSAPHRGANLVFTSLAFYLLLCLGYVAESNVIENDSPSMRIVRMIRNHPEGRISYQELKREFSNEEFVLPRLNDLVTKGHVAFDGTRYSLRAPGLAIARLARLYRQLIRRGWGG